MKAAAVIRSSSYSLSLLLLLTLFVSGDCFVSPVRGKVTPYIGLSNNDNNYNNNSNRNSSWLNNNPFRNVLKNMDDVIDDFMCKRMGNGEVFYGKRKFNPSGKVDGVYNGMGMSDKTKIDITREYKEIVMEERRRRQQSSAAEE